MNESTKKRVDWKLTKDRLSVAKQALQQSMQADAARLQEVFHRRAAKFASPGNAEADRQETLSVLVVTIGGENFAIELQHVERVFPASPITPVPNLRPELLGEANFLGQVHLVVDPRQPLQLIDKQQTVGGYFVLLRQAADRLGFRVDSVERIQRIAKADLAANESPKDYQSSYVRRVTHDKLAILDIVKFFDNELVVNA